MSDVYRGIRVGDTVMRVRGCFRGHKPGTVRVVHSLDNDHLRFEEDDGYGYAPSAYKVMIRTNPVETLFERRTEASLMREGGQAR